MTCRRRLPGGHCVLSGEGLGIAGNAWTPALSFPEALCFQRCLLVYWGCCTLNRKLTEDQSGLLKGPLPASIYYSAAFC